jgi:hypothetical protein
MSINPRWLTNKIEEMAKDIKDIKDIMKLVQNQPQAKDTTKYPINKGK